MDVTNTNVHLFFIYQDGRIIRRFPTAYKARKWLLREAQKRRNQFPMRIEHDLELLKNKHWMGDNPEYVYKYLPEDMFVQYQDKQWKAQDFWSRSIIGV